MITKLRRILGLESNEERLSRLTEVSSSIDRLSIKIDDLADEFTSKNENFKQILKSEEIDEDFKKSVKDKYDNFIEIQKQELQPLIKERRELKSQHQALMADKEIFKAVSDLSFYKEVKEKYKIGVIRPEHFDIILKAKNGVVKYADNIVLNEEGKFLILQRDQNDNNGGKWVVPGGHVDAGEEFYEAAKRELQEEAGITVEDCTEVGSYKKDGVEISYFKSKVGSLTTPIVIQSKEIIDSKWIAPSEIPNYEMPFNMAENLMKLLEVTVEETKIMKAIQVGSLSTELGMELIEKARSGIYENTPENRKLGRVGQKYGEKKEESKFERKQTEGKLNLGRSGKFIEKTKTSPKQTYKALKKWFDSENIKFEVNFAVKTSSIYITTESRTGTNLKIRLSNHSPAITDVESWKGIEVHASGGEIGFVSLDSSIGYKTEDIKNIFSIIDDSAKKIQGKDIDVKDAYEMNSKDVVEKYLKEFGLEDDIYGINREIILSQYDSIKYRPDYKEYINSRPEVIEKKEKERKEVEEKSKKEKETFLKIDKYRASNGAIVMTSRTKDSSKWTSTIGHIQEYSGAENKEKRKELQKQAIKELEEKVKNGEFDKVEKSYSDFDLIKAFEFGQISEDILEKARVGKYADTPENKRLKRVGQPYGSKKQETTAPDKPPSKKDENGEKQATDKSIEEHAKTVSEDSLQAASKGGDEELRIAAKKELDRREKEESPSDQPENKDVSADTEKKPGEEKSPVSEKGKDDYDTSIKELENKIRELRGADIDYSDEKAMEENTKQVQEAMKERQRLVSERDSLRKVGFEEYMDGFKNFSEAKFKEINEFYTGEAKEIDKYLSKNPEISASIDSYIGNGYTKIREVLTKNENTSIDSDLKEARERLQELSKEIDEKNKDLPFGKRLRLKKENKEFVELQEKISKNNPLEKIENISKFIQDNKISENLILNRRIKGEGINFFRSLEKGDVYEDKSFSSTSLTELTHFGDFNISILAKKGSSIANINNPSETEYLIDKGAKFRVLEKRDENIIVELL